MALHSGAAELRDGDYFGPPLNLVARLLSTGHGGQTLVSSATCELCHDRMPTSVVLTSLGEHLLKDVARRQTIYQLGHPSLPLAFAPLRTLLAPLDTRVPSIAVLPFANRSQDEEDEYFADGLADELLNVLAKMRGLRVAARTSAFSFKGKQTTIADVGQALKVAMVLEGSVRKASSRPRGRSPKRLAVLPASSGDLCRVKYRASDSTSKRRAFNPAAVGIRRVGSASFTATSVTAGALVYTVHGITEVAGASDAEDRIARRQLSRG